MKITKLDSHNTEKLDLNLHCCENLKSHSKYFKCQYLCPTICTIYIYCNTVTLFMAVLYVFGITYVRGCIRSSRTESTTKQTTTINTRWEETQMVMAAKLIRLTHRISKQQHLVTESYTICSSCSRRSTRKILDIPSNKNPWNITQQVSTRCRNSCE